jgi:large repetitive protein
VSPEPRELTPEPVPQRMSSAAARPGARHALALAAVAALVGSVPAVAAPAAFADTFTVTTANDGAGECTLAECTLREAVEAADGTPAANTIVVPPGTYTLTESKEGSDLQLHGEVTIEGSGPAVTVIKNGAGSHHRLMLIGGAGAGPTSAELWGVKLLDGEAPGEEAGAADEPHRGGDIAFVPEGGGSLTLEKDVISEGKASEGGGVYSAEGQLEVIDSTVMEGEAEEGGGVWLEHDSGETAHFEGDTFAEDEATRRGGGIDAELVDAAITNSTFSEDGARKQAAAQSRWFSTAKSRCSTTRLPATSRGRARADSGAPTSMRRAPARGSTS